jgi:PAS domain S-box-containing protein
MKFPLHILHLEDDSRDAELVQQTLATNDIASSVTRVETEADFIASLKQGGFDLIFADYTLPSFDGMSALKIAQRELPHVPFIFVSGTLDEEVAIEALKIGATDYVFKTRLVRIAPSVRRALREADERVGLIHAQEALRRSEAYLAEAQKLSHTGSFGWDISTGEIYWSQETFRIFGYEPAHKAAIEMVMRRTHPEDRSAVQQLIERVSRERKAFDFEHRLLMPDGSVKYTRVVGHPSKDESGRFEFVGAVTDITERKRGELLLRESEQRFRAIFNEAGTGITLLDLVPGQPVENNRALQTMLGCTREELSRFETYNELTFEANRETDATVFRELSNGSRDTLRQEKHFICRDGRSVWANVIFTLLRDPEGRPRYIISIHEDITERKQSEDALHQAQADLAHVNRVTTMGELTASLAHEVNQPIAAAVTNANTCLRWLTRDHPDLEEARDAAMRIVKDGTRAADIISRIRLLFKKGMPRWELVDVNEVIRDMIVLFHSEATRYNALIRTGLAADLPQVMADRVQLQQVLMNLMINALDAMKDVDGTRELDIKSQRGENEQLLVSVSDTGVGLPSQHADQIFNAFFTTKPHGTGMGLRICRSIAESHGGRLWATANPGRGATFHLTLPTKVEAQE